MLINDHNTKTHFVKNRTTFTVENDITHPLCACCFPASLVELTVFSFLYGLAVFTTVTLTGACLSEVLPVPVSLFL